MEGVLAIIATVLGIAIVRLILDYLKVPTNPKGSFGTLADRLSTLKFNNDSLLTGLMRIVIVFPLLIGAHVILFFYYNKWMTAIALILWLMGTGILAT